MWGTITLISEATNFLSNFNYYFDKISNSTQHLISNFDFNKIQVSDEVKSIVSNASEQAIRNHF